MSTQERSGTTGMQGTKSDIVPMSGNENQDETQHEDSQHSSFNLQREISRSSSLLTDCAQHTLGLMKSIGTDAKIDPTLRDFRKINAVAGLAREIAALAKVQLEAVKIAKGLT